jgi:DNA-binding CsgD family transcriptional regulator
MFLNSLTDSAEVETDSSLRAMLVVSPDGRIQFATARADHWIRNFFAAVSPLNRLPEAITRWLSDGASGTGLVVNGSEGKLLLRVFSREPHSIGLLLQVDSNNCQIARSGSQNLTVRQKEVLSWVAYGKTNAEIGQILGLATRTIGKHLERIFPKLGVENRTAASRFVQEER